jgi:TolA-binding protein
MSSSNAMSRRIEANSPEGSYRNEHDVQKQPRSMNGNPTQQLWKICTFHETRINQMETQIHKLSHLTNSNKSDKNLEGIFQKLERLEQENASFRNYITNANKKQEKKSISLEIEES